MLDVIEALAEELVNYSSGNLRFAEGEANDSLSPEPEAHRFLKLNERRLGRDFKLYAFMAKVQGEQATLCDLLNELVIPLNEPLAKDAGLMWLRDRAEMFGEKAGEWQGLIDDLRGRPDIEP